MIGDIPDVRREKNGGKKKRKRVKVEPLILATGGMTSAGGRGCLSFWLQRKQEDITRNTILEILKNFF